MSLTRAFSKLCEGVLPPSQPAEAGSLDAFAAVESRLRVALPEDYKRLVCAYGTGCWKGFLWVLSPFASNPHVNLLEQVRRQLDAERVIRARLPANMPFALYPERGGLLPWAMTDNGNRLYWLTVDSPAGWPTVGYESRGPAYDRYEVTCCEFLLRWLAGDMRVSVFPDDFEYGLAGAFEPTNLAP